MSHLDHSELWKRLEQFEFDTGTPQFGFADRLARENDWTREETEAAILEYKRFVYLAMAAIGIVNPVTSIPVTRFFLNFFIFVLPSRLS